MKNIPEVRAVYHTFLICQVSQYDSYKSNDYMYLQKIKMKAAINSSCQAPIIYCMMNTVENKKQMIVMKNQFGWYLQGFEGTYFETPYDAAKWFVMNVSGLGSGLNR